MIHRPLSPIRSDTRLAWDATEYNVDTIFLSGDDIWTPDITVYNQLDAMGDAFGPTLAQVYPSGDVFYSRPGNLHLLCRFSGMVNFPHDQLKCKFDVRTPLTALSLNLTTRTSNPARRTIAAGWRLDAGRHLGEPDRARFPAGA